MGLESKNLRDLLYSVISGNTVNMEYSTATDLLRGVVEESNIYTNWSTTTHSYNVSGYTIAQGISGAVLTDFYCNTGATLAVLTSGDTIVQSYISGTTIVPTGTTITETNTTTTGTTVTGNNLLKVNLYGVSGITVVNGTSGTSGISGSSGTSGGPGVPGVPGGAGTDGTSGTSGENGVPGLPGAAGADGTSGTSGLTGSSGTSGGGSVAYNIQNISDASYTGTTLSYYRTSGTTEFHLPAAGATGEYVFIKNLYGTLVVYPASGDTIEYITSKSMNINDSFLYIDGTSTNWDIN